MNQVNKNKSQQNIIPTLKNMIVGTKYFISYDDQSIRKNHKILRFHFVINEFNGKQKQQQTTT